ncbi:hypothetical protein K9N50_06155 [bacterium]|nr:hypothetical protein [bacterium]
MQKSTFIHILFFSTLVILSSVGCDDYNIVEPQFATEDDFDDIRVFYRDDLKQAPYFIEFAIPEDSHVRVSIYKGNGDLVKKLIDDYLSPGRYDVCWDLTDKNNQQVDDGLYCVSLQTDRFSKSMFFKLES